MEMTSHKKRFTEEQKRSLKKSAQKLQSALLNSKDPIAYELLKGELGKIIDLILTGNPSLPFEEIPHFEKMTRDYLPEAEDEYFEFYSLAKYGES